MDRRQFIKNSALLVPAISLGGFPSILSAANRTPTLRILGTHVTLQEEIRLKAEEELGFKIEFHPGGSAAVMSKAATDPTSFDLYEQWSNSIKVLWQSGAIQSIDSSKITFWDEINNLAKNGKISEQAIIGKGDAPHKILYVQPNGKLGSQSSQQVSFLPYVHNVDSFGYNTDIIPKGIPYKTESWGWLFDESHKGRVAIVNDPSIGIFDLALAAEAKGLMKLQDIGNMKMEEIDLLFAIAIDLKKRGQFRGVWTSVPQSVDLMRRGEVSIESMFSPAESQLKGLGIPCTYAAPKEGYRAWHGVMCMSSQIKSEQQDMAYQFMNWWLSGWAGAYIAKQGYYISNPERSRSYMSENEWGYWYQGKPATETIYDVNGLISVKEGEIRNGGTYQRRFENVAVWNSVMDTYDYSLIKWREFVITRGNDLV